MIQQYKSLQGFFIMNKISVTEIKNKVQTVVEQSTEDKRKKTKLPLTDSIKIDKIILKKQLEK